MAKRKSAETSTSEDAGATDPLHPRLRDTLFGHEAAEDLFLGAFNARSLHHAWLLTGERGIGKATFAYSAARFLSSQDQAAAALHPAPSLAVPATLPVARQIAAGAHPSLFVLGSDAEGSASIGVESVRKLRAFLSLTSPGGWRAMIVDSGERPHNRFGECASQGRRRAAAAYRLFSGQSWRVGGDADHSLAMHQARFSPARFVRFPKRRCRSLRCGRPVRAG